METAEELEIGEELARDEYKSRERLPYYSKRPPARPEVELEHRQRIKLWMAWCLIIVAIFVDLVELIGGYLSFEIIATIVGVCASVIFGIWFNILGVSYSGNTKRFLTSILMNVGELIPGLDAIPFWFLWTAGMILIVTLTRMEDRGEEPTILGALKRIAVWSGGPATAVVLYPLQRHGDKRRVERQRRERLNEAYEMTANPEKIEAIRQKYAGREQVFRRRDMGRVGDLEHKYFKIGKEEVSLREGYSMDHARKTFGKELENELHTGKLPGQNLLNLKKAP